MNRRPERFGDLLPGALADLAATHTTVNGEPPMTDDELYAAFRAGFEATGEGWNGEYPPVPEPDIREEFDRWKTGAA